MQVVDQELDPAPQRGRGGDHALGLVEHDPRLVTGGRGGVHLGPLLAVGDQQVEADAGGGRRLAVLPRHRTVGGPKAPQPVVAFPAEQGADEEGLPGREGEGLAGPLALGMAKEAEEVDRMPGSSVIEAQAAPGAAREVAEMALAGQASAAPSQKAPVCPSSAESAGRFRKKP